MNEEWRGIPGWSDLYYVSNYGRVKALVKSILMKDGRRRPHSEKILKCGVNSNGREFVTLCSTRQQAYLVHRLVALAFIGPNPEGCVVAHNDGNCRNNKVSNLRYATMKENSADRRIHGTACLGEKNPNVKLTSSNVEEIRKRLQGSETYAQIAVSYHISKSTIWQIANGVTWR